MNAMKIMLPVIVLELLPILCPAQEKPRIAVLQLKNENAGALEATVMTHLLENYFVNTDRYTVLERREINQVLSEQAAGFEVATDTDAARFGKLLKVQDVITGTLMVFEGRYLCEVRMINVETSSIEKSCTETCETNDSFAVAAKRIVEKISGETIQNAAPLSPEEQPGTAGEVKEPRELAHFRGAGLSSDDCDRFLKSGLSLDAWARKSRTSPLLAGCLGMLPVASGHYLTRNYGLAVFFSIVKSLSLVAISQTAGKNDERQQWAIGYAVACGAATVADVITSATSAAAFNSGLDKLSQVSMANPCNNPGLSLTITF
ncbi:MAG TPA: CsgG/HfaB family protein [Chitinivibrionales bacterium]|nr:CsgG/HfaB family protein [Chitinivibrionales bacterium]